MTELSVLFVTIYSETTDILVEYLYWQILAPLIDVYISKCTTVFSKVIFFPPNSKFKHILKKREVKTSCPFPMDQKENWEILNSFSYLDFFSACL